MTHLFLLHHWPIMRDFCNSFTIVFLHRNEQADYRNLHDRDLFDSE